MDQDKVCALCDAIDDVINAAVAVTDLSQLKPHVSQYTDAIRSEVEKSPWIKVSERLPEETVVVLVCYGDGVVTTNEMWDEEEEKYWSIENFNANDITHWMPLPEPPEESKPCR